jgi:hypothetical protein
MILLQITVHKSNSVGLKVVTNRSNKVHLLGCLKEYVFVKRTKI